MASSLAFLQPLSNVSSSSTLLFLRNPHHIPSSSSSLKPSNFLKTLPFKSLTASFSLAESDSPKSFQPNGPNFQSFLQELADSFDLPPDYFAQLPNDLRLDLNDAAFDLSNGRVVDECGQELGETLLNLSRAWEQADTSTSHSLASKLPGLEDSMTGNAKSGKNRHLESVWFLPEEDFSLWDSMAKVNCKRRSIIMGASLASFVLISVMAAVAVFFHVKQSNRIQEKENQLKVGRFLNDHKSHVPTRYSYANIKKMTNGFKNKLGEGGFGSVYSGELPTNGVPVVVKVLSDSKGNGEDFVNEVGIIGRIHHVNVVRLLAFSAEGGKRALIYELMPNGSLENFITFKDQSNNTSFDYVWTQNTGLSQV
ncbi:hypothetical protein C1H46_029572 [Malus baccata]|uniref:Protein kinase domain-containing protein n=1 Tax=Malus baccata TaxID=106549 RepID=A0A540LEZ0_MALBA|nr:hypothetical protein C1H46_029572 [Malus baccata]